MHIRNIYIISIRPYGGLGRDSSSPLSSAAYGATPAAARKHRHCPTQTPCARALSRADGACEARAGGGKGWRGPEIGPMREISPKPHRSNARPLQRCGGGVNGATAFTRQVTTTMVSILALGSMVSGGQDEEQSKCKRGAVQRRSNNCHTNDSLTTFH